MQQYSIQIHPRAELDIQDYIDHIMYQYNMPLTASRHKKSLYKRIYSLTTFTEAYPVSSKRDVLRYGANARTIPYKKMAIIYTVHDTLVVVRAVVPAALMKE